MPRHDYECPYCGHRCEMAFSTVDAMEDWQGRVLCDKCEHGILVRQPAAPNFAIKGFSARNGYSRAGH